MRFTAPLLTCCLALALTVATCVQADDTDLFLTPPGNNAAAAPNVLIILDNSANWSANFPGGTKFSAEMATLASVIGNLSDKVNVGLMMMDETGAGTAAPTARSYVRYAVRNMGSGNRAAMVAMINAMGINADKTNNASWGFAMFEAWKYFGGGAGSPQSATGFGRDAYAGFGQPKRDYPGNSKPNTAGNLSNNAFASATSRTYLSPITDSCQKSYIIFIGNGMPQSGADSGSPSAAQLLATVGGNTTTIPLPSTSARNNIADEYARFLYQSDVGQPAGQQNVITYTIAVYDPAHMSGSDPDMIQLMTSMANQGGGRYFAATDQTRLQQALDTIFAEVQAVNSVFASSTLPVSVNVRGTYLNQVYMGVFRPDPDASPRWLGNLKEYRLAVDSNGLLYLADANGNPVENNSTGFVSPTAVSYWTQTSSYWWFRPSGTGGASDAPDGDIVEKGAAAQVLRTTYASSQATRNVYTCTGCAVNDRLSGFSFSTSNSGITQAALRAGSAAERDNIINWVRGQDLFNENGDASTTDARASIHGDVLHSRPAVVNYNRNGDDNDIVVFYGGNDGMLHAVKGGQDATGGRELWAFVPPEFFGSLKRLYDDQPKISTSSPRPYFFDGNVGVWFQDVNGDGKLSASDGDKVYLYVSVRRGGRLLYALDVSNPDDPKLLWKHGCPNATDNVGCDAGFAELGQTWSLPQPATVHASANPVLFMGAGYDAAANDAMPAGTATQGRGILAIDGVKGTLLWQAGAAPAGAAVNRAVAGMTYSIASDLAAIDRNADGFIDRLYAPDTGGNVWRVDVDDPDPANWKVTLLARLGGSGSSARKFLFPPDVVFATGAQTFDAVRIGSGDREHPLDTSINDRFYMLKDPNVGTTSNDRNLTEADLYDATNNTVQDGTGAQRSAAIAAQASAQGWYIALSPGEKVVGNSVTLAATTFFGTNRPTPPQPGVCTPNLGEARLYSVGFLDASATMENNGAAGLTLSDRYRVRPGGGFPPSFVPISVQIDNQIRQGVVSGTQVITAPVQSGKRKRTFWFRDIDQ